MTNTTRPHLTLAAVRAFGALRGRLAVREPLEELDWIALDLYFGVEQTHEDGRRRRDVETEFRLGFEGASAAFPPCVRLVGRTTRVCGATSQCEHRRGDGSVRS